jgi:hypothetical protein
MFGLPWWPVEEKEKKYTVKEIEKLLEKVKEFNAGCIDDFLSKHVDKVFEEWKKSV